MTAVFCGSQEEELVGIRPRRESCHRVAIFTTRKADDFAAQRHPVNPKRFVSHLDAATIDAVTLLDVAGPDLRNGVRVHDHFWRNNSRNGSSVPLQDVLRVELHRRRAKKRRKRQNGDRRTHFHTKTESRIARNAASAPVASVPPPCAWAA